MAEICNIIQNKYVPSDQTKVLEKIIFDGDQLNRGLKLQVGPNAIADSEVERLEGLEPSFAVWHLKKNLYQVHVNAYLESSIYG